MDKLVEERSESINEKELHSNEINYYEKNMQFLKCIHCIVGHIFHTMYKH